MPTTVERLQVDVTADVSRAVSDLHRFEQEARRTARVISGMDVRVQGIDVSRAVADMHRMEAEARRTARIVAGMGGAVGGIGVPSRVTNTWNTYNNQVSRTSDNMKRLAGLTASALAGAGIGRVFVGGIKKAMDFDLVIRQVGVQTGQTGAALADLGEVAKRMGADTIYSASEAGNAMLELAKGGLTAAQIKGGALESALTLAAAGGLELADAGTAIVNGMGAFGLTAKDATRVTNALAGAANASSADVSDMTQALAQGGAGAHAAGLSIEEASAALALFANKGVKGADAGTSLKTMLSRLVPQTKKAADQMRDLGLKFTDANGEFLPLAEIAQRLKDRMGKLSPAMRSTAMATIFGSDATRAATFLMEGGRKEIDKYKKATSSQKSAQDLANTAMSGASGAWQNFTGSVETATISLGQKALPKITELLNLGTTMISDAKGWGDDFREYFGWMGQSSKDLYNAAKPLASMLGGLAGFINDLPGPVKEVGVQVGITALILPRLAAAIVGVGGAAATGAMRMASFTTALFANTGAATANARAQVLSAAKTGAGVIGFVALTQAAHESNDALRSVEQIGGAALLGFAVAGPIGLALGAGAGAIWALSSATKDANKDMREAAGVTADYTDTLDANTGAVTRNTRKKVYDTLMGDKATAGWVRQAQAAGVASRDIVGATLGNAGAQDRLMGALAQVEHRYGRLTLAGKPVPKGLEDTRNALRNLIYTTDDQRESLAKNIATSRESIRATQTWKEALKGLPTDVRTDLKASGYDLSARQVRNLAAEYKLIPEKRDILFRAFGLTEVTDGIGNAARASLLLEGSLLQSFGTGRRTVQEFGDDLAIMVGKISNKEIRLAIKATGSDLTIRQARMAREAFNKLPEEVSTTIKSLGGGATRKDIRDVARLAGMTDKSEIRLLFGAIGVEPTRRDIRLIRGELGEAGKKPANLTGWKRGLTDSLGDGKRTTQRANADLKTLLGGAGKGAKPDLGTFQGALTQGMVTGRGTARNGGVGIGADLKSGFTSGFAGASGLWSDSVAAAVNAAIRAGRSAADAHSPSRKTATLGRDMGDGLAKGMTEKRKKVVATAKAVVSDVVQAYRTGGRDLKKVLRSITELAKKELGGKAEDRMLALVKRQNKALQKQYGLRAKYARDYDRAVNTRDSRKATKSAFVENTYQGMYQQANVLNAGNNAGTIAQSLAAQVGKVKEFAALITRLKKMGYRDDIVTQIAQAGVENGMVAAKALVAASSTEQASINQSYASIASVARSTSDALGASLYDSGIRAAEGLVAGLKKKKKDVEATIMAMAMAMQKALKKALGIKSPSRVMMGLGRMTAQGLVNGLMDREKDVAKAGTSLARAIVVTPPRLAVAETMGRRGPAGGPVATQSGGTTTVFQFTTHNPVAEPVSRTTNKALDKAANLGLV